MDINLVGLVLSSSFVFVDCARGSSPFDKDEDDEDSSSDDSSGS